MKRIHVHLRTRDLAEARNYYTILFGQAPTLAHDDYLKWRLDDPAINLAITPGKDSGIVHLGLDLEQPAELATMRERLGGAGYTECEEDGAHCCYAYSDKVWSRDGDGVVWENFLTHELRETRDEGTRQPCCASESGAEARDDDAATRSCCNG